jgi:hypothetical protein
VIRDWLLLWGGVDYSDSDSEQPAGGGTKERMWEEDPAHLLVLVLYIVPVIPRPRYHDHSAERPAARLAANANSFPISETHTSESASLARASRYFTIDHFSPLYTD